MPVPEYTIAAVEDIELMLTMLRKMHFLREQVGLKGKQLKKLQDSITALAEIQMKLNEILGPVVRPGTGPTPMYRRGSVL